MKSSQIVSKDVYLFCLIVGLGFLNNVKESCTGSNTFDIRNNN